MSSTTTMNKKLACALIFLVIATILFQLRHIAIEGEYARSTSVGEDNSSQASQARHASQGSQVATVERVTSTLDDLLKYSMNDDDNSNSEATTTTKTTAQVVEDDSTTQVTSTLEDLSRSITTNDNNNQAATTTTKKKTAFCKEEGSVLNFSKDGTSYKCLDRLNSYDHELQFQQHNDNSYLPTQNILLLNQPIGHVTRTCHVDNDNNNNDKNNDDGNNNHMQQCLLPIGINNQNQTTNANVVNSLMPIRIRPWMIHPFFRGKSALLYYSLSASSPHKHTTTNNNNNATIEILLLDSSTKRWKKSHATLSFESNDMSCQSFLSPFIFVKERQKRFYMYIHGHQCKESASIGRKKRDDNPPTTLLLFTSKDGVSWKQQLQDKNENSRHLHNRISSQKNHSSPNYSLQLQNFFYTSNSIYNKRDDHYYVMARIHRGDESVVLCRSKTSPEGPFEEGPKIGRSIRNSHLFQVDGDDDAKIYVLFSMYGDSPGKILLGSIDTSSDTLSDWIEWKLLPGPRILTPEYWYEHGNENATLVVDTASSSSSESTGVENSRHYGLSHPRILLDNGIIDPESTDTDSNSSNATSSVRIISGLMFYTVQGGRGIATAMISIDLDLYRTVVKYRDRASIRRDVLGSSSLAQNNEEGDGDDDESSSSTTMKVTPLLVTGVGRTGTTSMCTLLNKIGIMVSHDNSIDCGPYPGPDGAVSWYDAFKSNRRGYERVIHMVRNPLKTMNSRIVKCERNDKVLKNLKAKVRPYEIHPPDDLSCSAYAIKNWVWRNSFVEHHASWRSQSELLMSEPLSLWELCMAGEFGNRCPELSYIESQIGSMPSNLNSLYGNATVSKFQKKRGVETGLNFTGHESWKTLADDVGSVNDKYIRIAQTMAQRYGYDVLDGFVPSDYYCEFTAKGTRKDRKKDKKWDCFIKDTDTVAPLLLRRA